MTVVGVDPNVTSGLSPAGAGCPAADHTRPAMPTTARQATATPQTRFDIGSIPSGKMSAQHSIECRPRRKCAARPRNNGGGGPICCSEVRFWPRALDSQPHECQRYDGDIEGGTLWLLVEYDAPGRGNNRSHRVGGLVETDETIRLRDHHLGLKFRQAVGIHAARARKPHCAAVLRNGLDSFKGAVHDDLRTRRHTLPAQKH